MNVEIGAEATLFPEKEYINGIAIVVCTTKAADKRVDLIGILLNLSGGEGQEDMIF
jgi:hypothetical protein